MVHMKVVTATSAKEKWDLSNSERLERGAKRREDASELFKRGRVRLACSHYEAVASFFSRLENFKDEEEQRKAEELRRVANLNRAACLLKLGDMKEVKELCGKVLKEDPLQPKALFRRAKAQMSLGEYEAALEDLQRLLEVEPANGEGQRLLKEARLRQKKQDKRSSNTFARMCNGLGSMPERDDRRDDDLVTAPNLDEEYAKLAAQTGVPVERLRKAAPAPRAAVTSQSSEQA
eukprot:TRINITY_DN25539_c0_g2_i1.p1 TRINITY_DN25539_c0_g2~~TRINITY_DN25539_c0_g2_i1.p1  ORF type:complete len:257 (+),score=83.10 TRINITY_DN25539_c0_g2_i1:70-771(+)